MRRKPSQEMVNEWCESEVTAYFKDLVTQRLQLLEDVGTTDVYSPFEPQRTQEILASRNGSIDAWEEVLEMLDGELDDISEDDDDDE